MKTISACLCASVLAAAALAADAAELTKLPVNQWTVVHDGPPGVVAAYARLEWMPGLKRGIMWPALHYRSRQANFEQFSTMHYYSLEKRQWTKQVTTFSDGLKPSTGNNIGVNYVWLPGIKRVLLLHGGGNRRAKKSVSTWLLDPETGKWEAIIGALRMADKSTDFNPSRGTEGGGRPSYGALVYDAHNKEAVLIGGSGTWGRVGKEKEKLAVGDWFFDEAGEVKRVRRVLAAEKSKVIEGRKWYPANAGTWCFSEETKKWKPIEQSMSRQPSGRILPGAAYDADEKKIVAFGGDNFTGPLSDTWVYDCTRREWSLAKPKTAPPPRAAQGMCYVADQKAVLLCGGFGPGWKKRKDTWVYKTAKNEWTRLAAELPTASYLCSATYDPGSKTVLYVPSIAKYGKSRKTTVLGLRLDLASAPKAPAPPLIANGLQYHCKVDKQWAAPLPGEWNSEENKGLDPEAGKKELAALPANTWVLRKQSMGSRARQWGSYIYDARNHKGYVWGGGHWGYTGCEVSEYDLLRNRWKSMNDIVAYKVNWRRGNAGGISGPSFQGWRLMGTHARKSYEVDQVTNSVVTLHGDVYDIKENRFVANVGRCPGGYGVGDQVCFEGTPDGIYGFHAKGGTGQLWLADVKAGKWNLVAKGGARNHGEYSTLCHDRKRNRLILTVPSRKGGAQFWSYDIAGKEWKQLKPANKCPGFAGCPTYVDDLDAILWTWGSGKGKNVSGKMTFYKIEENKFYTAPWKGPTFGSHGNLNNSPHYDPKLKLVVRISHIDRGGFIKVGVMRLDPETLNLTEAK
jgi:Galactose oxidase, central domain/Kelch motif